MASICLAQLPVGETNPLSPQSRASQIKKTVKIGVGLLPYIAIASLLERRLAPRSERFFLSKMDRRPERS
jgi:hypothetical protein